MFDPVLACSTKFTVFRIRGQDIEEAFELVLRYFCVSDNVMREYRHCTRRGKMEAIVESGDGGR
jgi:hypothetical protein